VAECDEISIHVGEHSRRFYFRVKGSEALPYYTTPFHCNCMAFLNQVRP
jgi:hypothetical protein